MTEAVEKSQLKGLQLGDLDNILGYRLRLAQQHVFREFVTRFRALNITPILYSALLLIERNPGCRQSELAAALGVRQPNMVERIDSLVERGLISRVPDPEDRRANVLKLTRSGKRFMIRLHSTHEQHTRQFVNQIGEDGYARLVELLAKLTD